MKLSRPLTAVAAVALVVGGGVAAVGQVVESPTADCTAAPAVEETDAGSQVTVVCTVPRPAPVTETVTVPGPTQTVTVTATPTPSASPTPTVAPTPTPTATPTPTSSPATWPNASNTGVPAGTTLTAYTGPSNIRTAGTVIEGKTLGCIQVNAPGVIIRKSRITCRPAYAAVDVPDGAFTGTPLLLEDVEINCQNGGGNAIGEANYTLRRANIFGCENGGDVNQNVLVEDSYVHDLYNPSEAHADGFQFADHMVNGQVVAGTINVTVRHNTIYSVGADGSLGTSAIIGNKAADKNILIENNLLAGGAYTLYCQPGANPEFRVIGNHFSRRFSPKVGAFGPSDDCANDTVAGNVDHETGEPIYLP